jgi:recombination protein RecR
VTVSAGPEIERLIALLARLPGMGPRSARRAALALLKRREQLLDPLARAMADASAKVRPCATCGALDTADPCVICAAEERDGTLICVVEEVGALWAMERAGAYRGRYHVLGGLLSALDGVGPEALRVGELVARAADSTVDEVILALPASVTVTSLARGVPVGGELDWLDDGTIAQALRARRPA